MCSPCMVYEAVLGSIAGLVRTDSVLSPPANGLYNALPHSPSSNYAFSLTLTSFPISFCLFHSPPTHTLPDLQWGFVM